MPSWSFNQVELLARAVRYRVGIKTDLTIEELNTILNEASGTFPANDDAWLQFVDVLRKAGLKELELLYREFIKLGDSDVDASENEGSVNSREDFVPDSSSDDDDDDASHHGGASHPEHPVQKDPILGQYSFYRELPEVKPQKYSIKQLYSMVPRDLTALRERLRLQKTVWRFDPSIPNREWLLRYAKINGHYYRGCGSKEPVVLEGRQLDQFYGSKHPLSDVRGLPFCGKPKIVFLKKTKTITQVIPVSSRFSRKKRSHPNGRKFAVVNSKTGSIEWEPFVRRTKYTKVYQRVLPNPNHKKYWYFLRTRGRFYLSKHHPLDGDGT